MNDTCQSLCETTKLLVKATWKDMHAYTLAKTACQKSTTIAYFFFLQSDTFCLTEYPVLRNK